MYDYGDCSAKRISKWTYVHAATHSYHLQRVQRPLSLILSIVFLLYFQVGFSTHNYPAQPINTISPIFSVARGVRVMLGLSFLYLFVLLLGYFRLPHCCEASECRSPACVAFVLESLNALCEFELGFKTPFVVLRIKYPHHCHRRRFYLSH